ncbi:WD40 repeat protein [Ceratobasidium sp. AG-Ba]|nr:WD40 repeat protein [Ceratobasidium sp. AG-Ba]
MTYLLWAMLTLFGHQDGAASLDALLGESAVSVGMRDEQQGIGRLRTKQLVFRGGGRSRLREVLEGGMEQEEEGDEEGGERRGKRKGKERGESFLEGSIDCIAMLDESTFVSGGDSGSLCLWLISKKKPVFTQTLAHGMHDHHSESEGTITTPRWITALGAVRYGDLFASGSYDSTIRLWKLDDKNRFSALATVSAPGFVNSLQLIVSPRGTASSHSWRRLETEPETRINGEPKLPPGRARDEVLLIAGVGQEPRLGRWMKLHGRGEKNAALAVAFPRGDLLR